MAVGGHGSHQPALSFPIVGVLGCKFLQLLRVKCVHACCFHRLDHRPLSSDFHSEHLYFKRSTEHRCTHVGDLASFHGPDAFGRKIVLEDLSLYSESLNKRQEKYKRLSCHEALDVKCVRDVPRTIQANADSY